MLKQSESEEKANRPATAGAGRSPVDRYTDDLVEKLDRMYDGLPDPLHRAAFVDALAWQLAKIAFSCGPAAAGDIVRRYGGHLASIAAHDSARREADEAKAAGKALQ